MPSPGDDLEKGPASPDEPYEEIARELEQVVSRLEEGNLSLAEALIEYERGVELVRRCNDLLDRAELRITELSASLSRSPATGPRNGEMRRLLFPSEEELDEE